MKKNNLWRKWFISAYTLRRNHNVLLYDSSRKVPKTDVGTRRRCTTAAIDLTIMELGGMWKALAFCTKKAVEHCSCSLMNHPSKSLEDSAESNRLEAQLK